VIRLLTVACALLAASCYSPSYTDCGFACADRACPEGTSCDDKGFCRTPNAIGECPGVCVTCNNDPTCIDIDNDNANCGGCGIVCPGTDPCFEGVCGGRKVKELSAGEAHSCALLESGSVHCWGADEFGQLGNAVDVVNCNGRPCRFAPLKVPLAKARHIASGGWSTCAVLQDETVSCWGRSELGAIGHDPFADASCMDGKPCTRTPIAIEGLTEIVEVTLSEFSGCARSRSGAVKCWGLNRYGNAGNGTDGPESVANLTPVDTSLTGALRVSLSGHYSTHGCALLSGTLFCWGDNSHAETGHAINTTGDVTCASGEYCARTPVQVALPSAVGDFFTGALVTCASIGTGQVYCWGNCADGIVGATGCTGTTFPPTLISVPSAGGFAAVAGKYAHACGTQGQGLRTIWCWGLQTNGQLGARNLATETCQTGVCRRTAGAVMPELKGTPFPARGPFTLAVDTVGVAWGWGANTFGQTGHPPLTMGDDMTCPAGSCAYAPVPVQGLP